MPNISGSGNFDLPRQSSSAGSFPSSPVRQSSVSAASQSSSSSHGHNNYSPIFMQVSEQLFLLQIIVVLWVCLDLFQWVGRPTAYTMFKSICFQWIDSVSQLMRMYPCAFEFSPVCMKANPFLTISCSASSSNNRIHWPSYLVLQTFLVDFMDCLLSCRFGNFLCNR